MHCSSEASAYATSTKIPHAGSYKNLYLIFENRFYLFKHLLMYLACESDFAEIMGIKQINL